MRIVSGALGGRRLHCPKGDAVRPTTDKVRQALFNILGPPPPGAVLDLCAGTGALGIEALSRGASHVTFVEQDARVLQVLLRNLEELALVSRATVLRGHIEGVLPALHKRSEEGFAWVFADPPYGKGLDRLVLSFFGGRGMGLLASEATLVIEHPGKGQLPEEEGALRLVSRRSYGQTALSFYTVPK